MIFQAGNVHESASLFNLKEKKFCNDRYQDSNPRPEVQVHSADHYTTKDLLEEREII